MLTVMFLSILVALVVGRLAGAAIGANERSHRRRRQARVPGPPDDPIAPLPPARAETPVEKLQREFARGDMSVDEYERELNKLYGIRG